jgi:hypothetical protein
MGVSVVLFSLEMRTLLYRPNKHEYGIILMSNFLAFIASSRCFQIADEYDSPSNVIISMGLGSVFPSS